MCAQPSLGRSFSAFQNSLASQIVSTLCLRFCAPGSKDSALVEYASDVGLKQLVVCSVSCCPWSLRARGLSVGRQSSCRPRPTCALICVQMTPLAIVGLVIARNQSRWLAACGSGMLASPSYSPAPPGNHDAEKGAEIGRSRFVGLVCPVGAQVWSHLGVFWVQGSLYLGCM